MSTKTIQVMTNGEVVSLTSKNQFAEIEALITDPNEVVRGEWIEGTQLPPKIPTYPHSEDVLLSVKLDDYEYLTIGYFSYAWKEWITDQGHYPQENVTYWQYIKPIPEVKE